MKHEPVPSGKRRPFQLSLDEGKLAKAELLGVDVQRACDEALTAAIDKRERERAWLEENREALESWDRWIERNGSPLDRFRAF